MFKKYGVLGIILIILVEINFFFKIQPFANWYFPIVWFSYILVIDALVYKVRGRSLISNHFFTFLSLFLLSIITWNVINWLAQFAHNWSYVQIQIQGVTLLQALKDSTILPALFETFELVRSVHLFDKVKLRKKHNISKATIYVMISFGVISFFLPIIFPRYAFPLVWLSFFLILDPINYLHKQPSIIQHLKDRKLVIPLSLLLAGIILGFLWEFWNYWAIPKWIYDIPFLGFFKIFEMPILGYLGYFPFSFELYSMYWFIKSLFSKEERLLIN